VANRMWQAVVAAALIAGAPSSALAQTQGTIKIGVLHSLSGTMAISETTLKDTILMMVDDINKKGGLLGKKVEAVVVDPASNWQLFAEKARGTCYRRRGSLRCSAAGPRCRGNRCCRSLRS